MSPMSNDLVDTYLLAPAQNNQLVNPRGTDPRSATFPDPALLPTSPARTASSLPTELWPADPRTFKGTIEP